MTDCIFEAFAPTYWAAGLPVIPLRERNKMPDLVGWNVYCTRMPDQLEMDHWLASFPRGNIGLPLGPASEICIIDVDTEDEALIAAICEACGPTPWVRVGKKGMALAYRYENQRNFKLRAADGGMICEFLGNGNQCVMPPSVHPDTQRPYTSNCNLWDVKDELPQLGTDIEVRLRAVLGVAGAVLSSSGPSRSLNTELNLAGNRYAIWLCSALKEAEKQLAKAIESDRNNALFRISASLASDVAAAEAEWEGFAGRLAVVAKSIGLNESEIPATLQSAWKAGSATPTPWIAGLSREWVYVTGQDHFRHLESGSVVKPAAFRTEFAAIAPYGEKNIARFLTDNRYIGIVQDVAFEPRLEPGVFEREGRSWYNGFSPSRVVAVEGDATPFVKFLEFLVPDEAERHHLLKMMAHLVRNPGEKLGHALILGSPEHGIGKSTLVTILERLLGKSNCRKATSDELDSQYQSYIEGKLLVLVEELNLGQGLRAYHRLKDVITTEDSPMRKLYENTRHVPNNATFFFLTNLRVPLHLEPSDRRFFVIQSPAKQADRDATYWAEFNCWWRESLGVIRYYLDQIELTGFHRFAPPPMTAAKEAMIYQSRNPVLQDLLEMVEEHNWPFHTDIVTRQQVVDSLKQRHPGLRRSTVDQALDEMGALQLGQHRLPSAAFATQRLGTAEKPSLWAIRHVAFWEAATPSRRVEEFLAHETSLPDWVDVPSMGLLPMSADDLDAHHTRARIHGVERACAEALNP